MKKYIISAAVLFAGLTATAQTSALNSAYFLDGYNFRHNLNPALAGNYSYVSLTPLGDFNMSLHSGIGVSDIIYPLGGNKFGTFLHPSVSADNFLSKLNKDNDVSVSTSMPVLSLGFFTPGKRNHFTTVELRLRVAGRVNVPYGVFEFAKSPIINKTYDLSGISMSARAAGELSVGHSFNVTEYLRIGAKVKMLVGLANAYMKINEMSAAFGENEWVVSGKGSGSAYIPGLVKPAMEGTDLQEYYKDKDLVDFSRFKAGDIFSNTGFAGDLGFEVDFGKIVGVLDGLRVSGSVLDLGFIQYKNSLNFATKPVSWTFDGFDPNGTGSETEKLEDLLKLESTGVDGIHKSSLDYTVNLGAEYRFPFFKMLSAGVLYSFHNNGGLKNNELQVSANLEPLSWLNAAVAFTGNSWGSNLGAVLGFNLPFFNFFFGVESALGKFGSVNNLPVIPLGKANLRLNTGITINIGKYHRL